MPEVQQNTTRSVIVRLGFDPTDAKKGLQDARRNLADYKTKAVELDVELKRERGRILSEFGSLSRAVVLRQISDEKKSADEKRKTLALYDEEIAKLRKLTQERDAARASAQKSNIAASLFSQQLRGPVGPINERPFNERVLQGFTLAGAAQFLGIGALATSVPELLRATATGMRDAALSAAEYAHNLSLVSEKTGIAVPELQKLEGIGKLAGLGLDDIVTATRRFSAALVGGEGIAEGLEGGSQRGAQALNLLGISARNQAGQIRPVNEVLADLAEVFARTPDGAEKTRIAVELFGRSGLNLIPLLNLGRKGFEDISAALDKYIPAVSDLKREYDAYELAGAKADAATTKLKTALAERLMPAVVAVKEAFADMANAIAEALAGPFQLPTGEKLTALGRQTFRELTFAGKKAKSGPFTVEVGLTPEERIAEIRKRNARPLADFDKEKLAFDEAHKRNDKEEMDRIVERVRTLQKQLQIEHDLVQELLKQSDELDAAAKAAAGLKDEEEKRWKSYREHVADQEQAIRKATAAGGIALADERLKPILGPQGILASREQAAMNEKSRLQQEEANLRVRGLSAERDLVENLKQQADLEREIWKVRLERVQLAEKDKKETEELLVKIDEEIRKMIAAEKFEEPALNRLFLKQPAAPAGALPIEGFVEQIERLNAQSQAGVISVQQQIDAHKGIIAALQAEISERMKNTEMGDADVKALAKMNDLLREQYELLKQTEKLTPFGRFASSFKEFSSIIGKFSSGLNKVFSEIFAGIEAIAASISQIQLMGGGTQQKAGGPIVGGSFLSGLKSLFSGKGGLFGALGGLLSLGGLGAGIGGLLAPIFGSAGFSSPGRGALSGAFGGGLLGLGGLAAFTGIAAASSGFPMMAALAGMLTNPITAVIAGVMAAAGAIFGTKKGKARQRSARMIKEINDDFQKTVKNFNEGAQGIAETIRQLEAERARAVASTRGGKKGNAQQAQQTIAAIDAQLSDLKRRQKEILDNFKQQVGIFALPEDYRDTAKAIADIAKALKDAASAGASAADQIRYLNGAMDDLKRKIGRDLRSEEQETLDLLKQNIDLQKQRQQILDDAAEAERNVKRSLGLAPALTPAQQAAKQIKDIRKQRDEQLKQIDEQQAQLKAQLDGRAELFGWSLKDLDAAGAREKILNRQLELERAITLETIARIKAQQDLFGQLASGKIPVLPAGVLPPGFSFPAGGTYTYTFGPGSVVINFPRTPTDPDEFANIVRVGLERIGRGRYVGGA